jgi:hypothetical protein
MEITIPLGTRERVSIGYGPSERFGDYLASWWWFRWRKGELNTQPWDPPPRDEPSSTGVREPLDPRLPSLEGEALPPDEFR